MHIYELKYKFYKFCFSIAIIKEFPFPDIFKYKDRLNYAFEITVDKRISARLEFKFQNPVLSKTDQNSLYFDKFQTYIKR